MTVSLLGRGIDWLGRDSVGFFEWFGGGFVWRRPRKSTGLLHDPTVVRRFSLEGCFDLDARGIKLFWIFSSMQGFLLWKDPLIKLGIKQWVLVFVLILVFSLHAVRHFLRVRAPKDFRCKCDWSLKVHGPLYKGRS